MSWLKKDALYLAWVFAFAGAILSFYFGEIQQIEPCRLCWYQRMALFPLVILLGMANYRGDRSIILYAMPFAILGFLVALYHSLEPHLAILQRASICGEGKPCSNPIFSFFGFVTFPVLSAAGFLLIALLLYFGKKRS